MHVPEAEIQMDQVRSEVEHRDEFAKPLPPSRQKWWASAGLGGPWRTGTKQSGVGTRLVPTAGANGTGYGVPFPGQMRGPNTR